MKTELLLKVIPKTAWSAFFIFGPGERCGGGTIPANHPDFIRTVLSFYFQNLQKLGRPDFQEFQAINIPVFKVIF